MSSKQLDAVKVLTLLGLVAGVVVAIPVCFSAMGLTVDVARLPTRVTVDEQHQSIYEASNYAFQTNVLARLQEDEWLLRGIKRDIEGAQPGAVVPQQYK